MEARKNGLFALFVGALVALASLSHSTRAQAYPWMIRHEYTACVPCHADPSGGGLLTEYGRAQGETLLRTHYGAAPTDSGAEAGKAAEFLLGAVNLPSWLLLGGDAREAALYVKPQGQPATTDIFLMQSDFEAQASLGRVRASVSVGFSQEGAFAAAITDGSRNNLVSRVHWLGVDLGTDNQFLLRTGRLNVPFGLRSVEHVAWTRVYTHTDSNDNQQDGAAFSWNVDHLRGEVMGIAGNFQERPDAFRERGYSGYAEWDPTTNFAVGASSLIAHSNVGVDPNGVVLSGDLLRQAHGVFARYAPVKPLVLSTEDDFLFDSQPATNDAGALNFPGFVGQAEADLEVIQGVHVVAIGELLDKRSDLPVLGNTKPWFRGWGFVNWFFAPHADVRFDAIYESDAQGGQRFAVMTLLGQLHVYL